MMRRSIKKLAAGTLVLAMTAGLLTACGDKESSSDKKDKDGKVTITLGMHVANTQEQEPVTYKIVEQFMKDNPDIKVEIQGNDKDEHVKKMKMAAQSNELPDVFWMDSSVAPELADAELLLDLKDFLKANPDVDKALDDNMKKASEKDGKQYGLPYQALVTGIWYNKDVFKKNNVQEPKNGTTYEELLKMVKTFKDKGVISIDQGAKDTYSIWAFLIAFERYGYFDKIDDILAGKEKFNNPEYLKFFEKLEELGKAGAFPENCATKSYFQAKESFNAGKSAMFDSGAWDAGEVEKKLGENVGFWWGPTFSDSDSNQKVKMKVSSAPLCVSAAVGEDDSKKDAVYKFLAYYYGENAAKLSYEGSIVPSTNYQVDVNVDDKPGFKAMMDALNDTEWVSPEAQPDLVLNEAVQAQLYDSIYGTMLGTYSAKEALDKIDDVLAQQ